MQSSNNKRNFTAVEAAQPQSNFYSYQSSSVTYGGHDGAYYKASSTRRTGSDGVRYFKHIYQLNLNLYIFNVFLSII